MAANTSTRGLGSWRRRRGLKESHPSAAEGLNAAAASKTCSTAIGGRCSKTSQVWGLCSEAREAFVRMGIQSAVVLLRAH
eukprot:408885-Pyramimonas_sp.AAC.1